LVIFNSIASCGAIVTFENVASETIPGNHKRSMECLSKYSSHSKIAAGTPVSSRECVK
jgi:hypothetical protein